MFWYLGDAGDPEGWYERDIRKVFGQFLDFWDICEFLILNFSVQPL
jgi:hypothetical protein